LEHKIRIDESTWEIVKFEAKKRKLSTNELVKQALQTFLGIDHAINVKLTGDIEE